MSVRNCAGEIVYNAPSPRCPTLNTLSCDDPYTVLIQAILNLEGDTGSDLTSIFNESNNICTDLFTDESEVLRWITSGLERGLFRWGSNVPTYMVNANMTQVHPGNQRYWRCPGVQNSFYRCARRN